MIEVFKTNVIDPVVADKLLEHIHTQFMQYKANFDLQDCDNILRVANTFGHVDPDHLISLLNDHGFDAQVLPG